MFAQYKYLAIALAILALVVGSYFKGRADINAAWDLDKERVKNEIAELKNKSIDATVKEVIKYVNRVETVKVKGDTITVYVDRFITAESDAKCVIPNNFVLFHDLAAKNITPPPLVVEGGAAK